MFVLMKMMRV